MTSLVSKDLVATRYPQFSESGGMWTVANSINAAVESAWIAPTQKRLEALLANDFTVPFSSNNATAIDMLIDMVWVRYNYPFEKDSIFARLQAAVNSFVGELRMGMSVMMLSSGYLQGNGEPVYNPEQSYHPAFGMGDPLDFRVDTSEVQDEASARGQILPWDPLL